MFRTWCSQLPLRSPFGPQLITFPLRSCGYDFHIPQSRDLRHVPLIVTSVTPKNDTTLSVEREKGPTQTRARS